LSNLIFTDGQYFCFQVGAFRNKSVADDAAKELYESGHNAFVLEATPFDNDEIWYRIRIGYFDSLAETKSYKSKYFD
jgi:cell division septation protein DedD